MIHPLSCFYEFIVRQFNRFINVAMDCKSSCYSEKYQILSFYWEFSYLLGQVSACVWPPRAPIRRSALSMKMGINQALRDIKSDGTYRQINAKYFPLDID